jgi:hypothetical protein
MEIERQEQAEKQAIRAAGSGQEADCEDADFSDVIFGEEEPTVAGIKISKLPL